MENYIENIHNYLIEYQIATSKEIRLVTSINGTNEESYNSILYSRTGYRDLNQIIDLESH